MSDEVEEWRPVPGYEGLYRVSDRGRVWSEISGQFLTPNRIPGGYLVFHLYGFGKSKRKVISGQKLVLLAFVGPRPQGKQACHNNGVRNDNRLSNLRYDTPKGNNADKKLHGTYRFGETAAHRKLSEADVRAIRARRGERQQDLADEFGCTYSNVSAIQRRKSWCHVS